MERVEKLEIHTLRNTTKIRAQELEQGQIVIVTARWALVFVGLLLLLWRAPGLPALQIGILLLLALAIINFFLHAHFLSARPIKTSLTYWMSVADLVVISSIVLLQEGFHSQAFVFYCPAVLAYSLVFSGPWTALLTFGLTVIYSVICLSTLEIDFGSTLNQQILLIRLLTVAGIAYLGYRYQLVEQRRRLEAGHSSPP